MKIKDIENKELRDEAIRLTHEDRLTFISLEDVLNSELMFAFAWGITSYGYMFWRGVDEGEITELPVKKDSNEAKDTTDPTDEEYYQIKQAIEYLKNNGFIIYKQF